MLIFVFVPNQVIITTLKCKFFFFSNLHNDAHQEAKRIESIVAGTLLAPSLSIPSPIRRG